MVAIFQYPFGIFSRTLPVSSVINCDGRFFYVQNVEKRGQREGGNERNISKQDVRREKKPVEQTVAGPSNRPKNCACVKLGWKNPETKAMCKVHPNTVAIFCAVTVNFLTFRCLLATIFM